MGTREPSAFAQRPTPMRLSIIFGIGLIACSCGTANSTTSSSSTSSIHPPEKTGGVNGHVLAGPTCPVERPGVPVCQPRPVTGSVKLGQGGRVVASTHIDQTGLFALGLPAGTYTVTVDTGDGAFPICKPVEVTVSDGAFALLDINCDTGIR